MASSERFAFKWLRYPLIDANHELQFQHWVHPLTAADFRGKRVLDAGCGIGANSFWALSWGASEVVAFDYDERTVALARQNLARFPNAAVLFKSVYDSDWREAFDLVMCIGVVHHLENPALAMTKLAAALRPGGTLVVWVYSREGNEWILRWVDPIRRRITSRLPLPLLHALSYACSVPLWAFVKLFRGPIPYLKQLAGFRFWHIHSIVFDQLLPRVAHYWRREEALRLFDQLGLRQVIIRQPVNRQGWTVLARK